MFMRRNLNCLESNLLFKAVEYDHMYERKDIIVIYE